MVARKHRSLAGLALVSTVSMGSLANDGPAERSGDGLMPLQTAGGPNLVTASPEIPNTFPFGQTPIGTVQQVTWTILNIGDAATGTLGINSSNSVDFDPSVPFCPSLAPFQTCSVTVSYVPQSLGPHSSTFSVTGFPLAYTFTGVGIDSFVP